MGNVSGAKGEIGLVGTLGTSEFQKDQGLQRMLESVCASFLLPMLC